MRYQYGLFTALLLQAIFVAVTREALVAGYPSNLSRSGRDSHNSDTAIATENRPFVLDGAPEYNKRWSAFSIRKYGLDVQYPGNFLVQASPTIENYGALSSFVFAPKEYKGALWPPAPLITLEIYKSKEALPAWFKEHETKKRFDDPSVSMKNSRFYFREATVPQRVALKNHSGLTFFSRTMSGSQKHVLVASAKRGYIIDWAANEYMMSGKNFRFFWMILATMR